MTLDDRARVTVERIKNQLRGSHIVGINAVTIDLENIDHMILAAYFLGKEESSFAHNKELMRTIDLFG